MEIGVGWVYLLYASSSMGHAGAQTPSRKNWQAEALAEQAGEAGSSLRPRTLAPQMALGISSMAATVSAALTTALFCGTFCEDRIVL